MEIPWERLNPETLRRVIEEFVTREGTEYGPGEVSLAHKVDQVILQLRRRQAVLSFDADNESCQILPAHHHLQNRHHNSKGGPSSQAGSLEGNF